MSDQDWQIEQAVIGAMLHDPACAAEVLPLLSSADLVDARHKRIYEAIQSLADGGDTIDLMTIRARLEARGHIETAGGAGYLIEARESVYGSTGVLTHVRLVRDRSLLRRLRELGTATVDHCGNSPGDVAALVDDTMAALGTLSRDAHRRKREEIGVTKIGDIVTEHVDWLWCPYVPRAKMTLLEGDPGIGKTWIALNLSAIISRGWPFPNYSTGKPGAERDPGNVLYMTAEDGLADTIRPRLESAGADLERVHAITGARTMIGAKAHDRPITLQDIDLIEDAIVKTSAILIVVDPLTAFVPPDVSLDRAAEITPILAAFSQLIARHKCAALVIRHWGKGQHGSAIKQGLGSIGIAGVARSIIAATKDPENDQERILVHVKSNLAAHGQSIRYSLGPDGFSWLGASAVTAEDAHSGPSSQVDRTKIELACGLISEQLDAGPINAAHMVAILKKERVSDGTISKAKTKLGVESIRIGSIWVWRFSTVGVQNVADQEFAL